MKNVTFKLNDFQYTINNKLTLIQACLKNKVDVPRFCFHEKLSIAGNCRMCLVEDLKQVKPVASCAINVSNSMSIYTNTVKVKKARESVLEFLLANHPLDCPICDQGGECDLQDQSLVFGSDRGRFYEFKRSVEDKDCGPLIKTIMNRCIHCTRCVRFSNEIAGVNILGVTGRGSKMEIGFYVENIMRSELSGNIIDLCPVGALTSKPFSFTSRPWELKSYNSIDIFDNMHSNIRVDVRGTKIMRVLPRVNSSINEDWITDKIRFSYDGFRRQRLHTPMLRFNQQFVKASWRHTFVYLKNYFISYDRISKFHQPFIIPYLGDYLDIETLFMVKRFTNLQGSNYYYGYNKSISTDNPAIYMAQTSIQSILNSDVCLIFGLNLRLQLPLLNAKIRQLVTKKHTPVYVLGYYSNFNFYTKHISTNPFVMLSLAEGSHWLVSKIILSASSRPLLFVNEEFASKSSFLKFLENMLRYSGLNRGDWNGFNIASTKSSFFAVEELSFLGNNNQNINMLGAPTWLFNYDSTFKKEAFTVYQGHHGDLNAVSADIILPSSSFIEKNSFYANMWGVVQKTKKILFNVGESRDDWKILNAFIEASGLGLKRGLKNSFELISEVSRISPFLLYNVIGRFSAISNLFCSLSFIHNSPLPSLFNEFYMSDSITRNSKVMSLSSKKFKTKYYNFY